MKKTLLLTIFIVLLSVTNISAAPSTQAGNGGIIITIKTNQDNTDPIIGNQLNLLNNLPNQTGKVEVGYTTITTKVDGDQIKQNIVKPGISTDIVKDNKTNITTIETVTEYGTVSKTVIDDNTGITTTNTVKKDGTTINTVKDLNKGVSTTIETKKDGFVTTTTTDLRTGVATSISDMENGTIKKVIIVPNGASAPEGLETTKTNNNTFTTEGKPLTVNMGNYFTVFLADVFEFEVDDNKEELLSSRQKYVELTKIPLALDERSKDTEDIRSNEITLVPRDNVLSKIDNTKFAPSISYISEDSYMSDFYELQVYLKLGEDKELTHEGMQITLKLPEYVTDDVDDTRSGVVHYEQDEGIYEFVLFDEVNYETKEVTFTLRGTSPISYVFKYKTGEENAVVTKCRIHWLILLSIVIYVIASLLIHNKKTGFKLISVLEALVSILLALYTKELWCIVFALIALISIVIMAILIRNANKEEDEEEQDQ